MKCVLDTDVLVAGLRSAKGASRELLRMIGRKEITAVATVAMMVEYEAVLKWSQHLEAAKLTTEQVDTFLDAFAALCIPVTPYFLWRPMLRDPNDEMVLEAAVNGEARVIATFNIRHFSRAAHRFDIEALKPSEVLRRLKR